MLRDCLVQAATLAATAVAPCVPDTTASDSPAVATRPALLADLAVVGGVTGLVTVLNPNVRAGVFERGSLSRVLANFRDPIRRAIEGGRGDGDAFTTNYVAHPLSWGAMAFYLRQRGYSRGSALLFTQAHSVAWEFVIEGSFQKPSGRDLVTNLGSSVVAIYVLHELLGRSPGAEGGEATRISLVLEPVAWPTAGPGARAGGGSAPGLSVGLAVSWR